jgi:8-oxo-dGTP pyrophosphatase MutT (NUDIX family)
MKEFAMLSPISEVLQRQAGFQPTWKAEPPDCLATDPRFGMIVHAVACDESGPQYDFPVWLESTGAICVAVDQDERIVMLRNYRPALADAQRLGQFPAADIGPGRISLELPRGFPKEGETPDATARREVEEETRFPVFETSYLGATNTNTTYFAFCNRVYLVRVDSRAPQGSYKERHERIEEVLLMSASQVLQSIVRDEIICGLTKSALMSYFAWRETSERR